MNTRKPFSRIAVGLTASLASFGAMQGVAQAETLPSDCRVFEIGDPVSKSAEQALDIAGFDGIVVDGRISTNNEQASVLDAQVALKASGFLRNSVRICGYAGDTTRQAAEQHSSSAKNVDKEPIVSEDYANISLDDCSRYDEYTKSSIISLQEKIGVYPDGKFGNQTCRALIRYQDQNGLSAAGRGALGPKTAARLGIALVKHVDTNKTFNPEQDCPKKNSCEVYIDLSTQRGSVLKNDGNPTTANGETLFTFSVQSGKPKPGSETNTGLFILGAAELGKNGSPWRVSTISGPNTEPNLYKFRRLVPAEGGWSGEGIHGSAQYGRGSGSAGCVRTTPAVQDILESLPTNVPVLIMGTKQA